MFQANEAVVVNIVVDGKRIAIPGITTSDEFTADRVNRNTGSLVPTQYCEVITFHQVPAEQSRSGAARTYYKAGRQSAAFMDYRTESCPELDELLAEDLIAAVAKSLAEVQQTSVRPRAASPEHAVKPKAVFTGQQLAFASK